MHPLIDIAAKKAPMLPDFGSRQLTEPRDSAGYPTGNGLYQIATYQTQVRLQMLDGKDWFDFKMQQVGYKKVREIRPPL